MINHNKLTLKTIVHNAITGSILNKDLRLAILSSAPFKKDSVINIHSNYVKIIKRSLSSFQSKNAKQKFVASF